MTVEQLEKWLLESPQSCWHGFETWDCLTSSVYSIRFSPSCGVKLGRQFFKRHISPLRVSRLRGSNPAPSNGSKKTRLEGRRFKSQNRQEILTAESLLKSAPLPSTYTHDINSREMHCLTVCFTSERCNAELNK